MNKLLCTCFLVGLFFSCFSNALSGQQKIQDHNIMGNIPDSLLKHEIGLLLESSFPFHLLYKNRLEENKYLRLRLTAAIVNKTERIASNHSKFNLRNSTVSFSVGYEKRKALKDQLFFVHGPEVQIGLSIYENELRNNNYMLFTPKLEYILGLHYEISNRFYINAEIFPGISNTWRLSSKQRTSNKVYEFNGTLAIADVRLTVAFKL